MFNSLLDLRIKELIYPFFVLHSNIIAYCVHKHTGDIDRVAPPSTFKIAPMPLLCVKPLSLNLSEQAGH